MLIELAVLPTEIQQQILHIKQGEQIIIAQQGEIIKTATINEQPSYAHGDFNFDLNSLQQSIESGRIEVPKSVTKDMESFDKWLDEITA